MEAEGTALLGESGLAPAEVEHVRSADLRDVGQGHEVRVELPPGTLHDVDDLIERFEREYGRLYGRRGPRVPVEAINWRVVSSGPRPALELGAVETTPPAGPPKQARPAYFPTLGGFVETPVHDRYALQPGASFAGPAIVEERESTLLVGPGQTVEVTAELSLSVTLRGT